MPCGSLKLVYKSNKTLFLSGNPKIKNVNSVYKLFKHEKIISSKQLKTKTICKFSRNGDLITQLCIYL